MWSWLPDHNTVFKVEVVGTMEWSCFQNTNYYSGTKVFKLIARLWWEIFYRNQWKILISTLNGKILVWYGHQFAQWDLDQEVVRSRKFSVLRFCQVKSNLMRILKRNSTFETHISKRNDCRICKDYRKNDENLQHFLSCFSGIWAKYWLRDVTGWSNFEVIFWENVWTA